MSKDFILEDPQPRAGQSTRAVDVPSPLSGYVNAVNCNAGFVEIMDRQGGEVIARVRHMSGITVEAGGAVLYGQSLGTQNNSGLNLQAGRSIHVHLDMDTRYYQHYQNYISDLSEGRLPVQAEFRRGIGPRPTVDDGVARIGETSERVRDAQVALAADGYLAIGGRPVESDGVYRPGIQAAVIAFQQDHGLLQTGDIDLATWQQATHINRRAQGVGDARPEGVVIAEGVLGMMHAVQGEPLAPGDPRHGLRPPSDPSRSGRAPQWETHAGHTQERDPGGLQAALPPQPGAPVTPDGGGRPEPPDQLELDVRRPPVRQRVLMLDDPSHPSHDMYLSALHALGERDAQLGRASNEISRQLAGGLVEKARERGLDAIGAARFTADGTKVGMTDTEDLCAPWARKAVGDVAQLAGQSLACSSENVAAIDQRQALERNHRQDAQAQATPGLEDSAPKGPRMV